MKDSQWYADYIRTFKAETADQKLVLLETADLIEEMAGKLGELAAYEGEERVNKNVGSDKPKFKRYKWIKTDAYVTTSQGSLPIYDCPVCKNGITIDEFDSYCPCCGAPIDGYEL